MDSKNKTRNKESIERSPVLETESLLNHSRQELLELARNLSNGKYKKDSLQREKIMQLLVKQLSSAEAAR